MRISELGVDNVPNDTVHTYNDEGAMSILTAVGDKSSKQIYFCRQRKEDLRGVEYVRDHRADPLCENIGEYARVFHFVIYLMKVNMVCC